MDLTDNDEWNPSCVENLENSGTCISSVNMKCVDKILDEYMFVDAPQQLNNSVNISVVSRTTKLELIAEFHVSNWNISITDT